MKKKLILLLATATLGSCLVGCSNFNLPDLETDNNEIEAGPRFGKISNNNEVTNYVNSLKYSEAEVLKYDLGGSVSGTPGTTDDSNGKDVTTLTVTKKEKKSAESGTGSIDTIATNTTLFPGQLLVADDKLVSGSPTICDLKRGSADFRVNLAGLSDPSFNTVVGQKNVQDAIDLKIKSWPTNSSRTASLEMKIEQAYSQEQINVEFGVGLAEKFSIKGEVGTTNEKKTYILSYKDIFYTANIINDSKNLIFDDDVTTKDIETWTHDKNGNVTPLLMMDTCNYGKVIYFKVETAMSEDQVKLAFGYAGSVDVDAQAEFKNMTSDCSISYFVYGGSLDSAAAVAKQLNDSTKAEDINKILNYDTIIDKDNVENAVLLSYTCRFIDGQQRSAGVVSTSTYYETTYYTINSQRVYVRNEGGFEIKKMWIFGRKIKSWDEKGNPVFGDYQTLYEVGHIPVCQDRTYLAPANYGQIKFKYDISWGSKPAYDGRVSQNNFFENCDIRTCGTTFGSYIKLTVDGNWQKI